MGDKWVWVEKAYCDWAQKKVAEAIGSLRDDIREEIAKQFGSSVEELFGSGGQTPSQTSPTDDCRQAKTRLDEDRNRHLVRLVDIISSDLARLDRITLAAAYISVGNGEEQKG